MELCVLIPAKDEELTIAETITDIHKQLEVLAHFNILVVDDHSVDRTLDILVRLTTKYPNLQYISNELDEGVGNAIRYGLSKWEGDIIAICMADGSDAPKDIIKSYLKIEEEGYDCVFGSRFIKGGRVDNYPPFKLFLNRLFNIMVRIVSGNKYSDYTNIFKVYHRRAIDAIEPLVSKGFSIGLEMSLKAFNGNLKIAIIPITWRQRRAGNSKLNLRKNFGAYMSTLRKSLSNGSEE